MRIDRRNLLVVVVAILAVTALPASVVSATDELAVGSQHSTTSDFNSADTLDNVTVSDGTVTLEDGAIIDDFEDGDTNVETNEWSGWTRTEGDQTMQAISSDPISGSYSGEIPVSLIGADTTYEINRSSGINVNPELKFRGSDSADKHHFRFYDSKGAQLTLFRAFNGEFQYYDGSSYVTITSWTAGQNYDIRFEMDYSNDEYNVVIDGTTYGPFPFWNSADDFDTLEIRMIDDNGDGSGGFIVDDVRYGNTADVGIYEQTHNITNSEQAQVNFSLTNASATVTISEVGSGDVLNQTTFTSDGDKTLTWATSNADQLKTNVTFEKTEERGKAQLFDESILFANQHPIVDNASASPSSGETVSQTPVQLSIDVSDEDFATAQDDNVSVTFYNASDDSKIGSQTLSSDGTASTSWDPGLGEHRWYIVAEDEYGGTTTSDTFVFNTPHELEIRDEENPNGLINNTTTDVTVTFFGSDEVFERTTSTGIVDLSGLPDEQMIVSVDADGYVTRQVIIESITEQQTAYLLNETSDSVDIRFRLEDPTGQFTEENSQLFVERAIQRDGTTTFRTIAGDEIGQGGYPVSLANDQRYQLVLRNNQGDERTLTGFMTQTSETVTLQVESVEYRFGTGDTPYKWTASYTNETSDIDVAYTDEDNLTSSLTVRIIEQQNNTTVYENVWTDPSEVTTTVAVDGNETSRWLVQLEIDRDGETFELETMVGQAQFPVVGDLDEDWQHRIAVALVFIVAGLFGVANASVGALVASLSTGILWVIGWMPPSVGAPMIFVGMTIASLFYVQNSGGGIQ